VIGPIFQRQNRQVKFASTPQSESTAVTQSAYSQASPQEEVVNGEIRFGHGAESQVGGQESDFTSERTSSTPPVAPLTFQKRPVSKVPEGREKAMQMLLGKK